MKIKIINKKSRIVKLVDEEIAKDYLGTNEWTIFKEETEKPREEKVEDSKPSRVE